MFAEVNFSLSGRQCFIYPDTLEIGEVVNQLLATKKELGEI